MLSERASSLLNEPKFFQKNLGEGPINAFNLSIKDKKLTVNYQLKTNSTEDLLREVLSIFLNNRELSRLKEITIREIFNFLRDGHQELKLDSDTQSQWENSLQIVKSELLIAYFHLISSQKSEIDRLSYLARNQFLAEIFSVINTDLYPKSDYQFHHFHREYVYFYKNPKVVDHYVEEALEKFLTNLYQEGIKLVAVKV